MKPVEKSILAAKEGGQRKNHARRLFSHLSARDAELVEQLQFAPELRTGNFAAQKLAVF
jgi:hypothetical protein